AELISVLCIHCFDCQSDRGSCNVGECEGEYCIKMETISKYKDGRIVQKHCSNEKNEKNSCSQVPIGSYYSYRCVCDHSWCNGDDALISAGLEESSGGKSNLLPSAQTVFILLFLFFVAVSFSILFVNAFCTSFC
uniref:Activin_recp domain-containing protein n=1 Tax=Syphacia muris TaxID=451379 RepID=A0A0N5AH37_9BILA